MDSHKNHKIFQIKDEKAFEKENILIENSIQGFNGKIEMTKHLKEKIENEIDKINLLYDEVIQKVTSAFLKKHEVLLKKENEMKEKLQNEVTKVKESLENYLSELNKIIKYNERIIKGINKLENEKEKNLFKNLSYISKISKIQKEIQYIFSKSMKNLKFTFEENENEDNIRYEYYYFNCIIKPKNINFKNISSNSLNISWDIDDIFGINNEDSQNKYIVEIRKTASNEKFLNVYEGKETNCFIDKLSSNTKYEIKVSYVNKELIFSSDIQNFETDAFDSTILRDCKRNKELSNKIIEWTGCKKFELLYRGTKDGSKSEIFHNKCDNKGPTVCLYKSEKGNIFGGYASISWTNEGNYKAAPESFIFTLTNNCDIQPTKFNNSKVDKSVFHRKDLGPTFYDDICIYEDFLSEKKEQSAWSSFPLYYNDSTGKGALIFTGENNNNSHYFKIKEIEVFKVSK